MRCQGERTRTRLICMSGACSELVGSGVHMWPICAHHDQRCRHSVVNACCGVSKMRPRPRGRHPGDGEGDGIAAAQVEGAAAVTAPPHLLLYRIAGHRGHRGGDEHPVRGHVDGRVAVGGWLVPPARNNSRSGATNPKAVKHETVQSIGLYGSRPSNLRFRAGRAGQRAPVRSWPRNGGGWPQVIRRPMRSATRGADPRVEVGSDVEREVAWAGASGRVEVVQVADDVVRRPVGTPGRQPSHLDRILAGSRRAVAVAHRTPRGPAQGPGRTRAWSPGAVRLAGCFLATGRGRLPMLPWCFMGGLLFPDPSPDWLGAAGCGRRRQQEREPSGSWRGRRRCCSR